MMTKFMSGTVLAAALAFNLAPAFAAAGPFQPFLGEWRGSGSVVGSNGATERINCRATYSGSDAGQSLTQKLVCASDSYKFQIEAYVEASGTSVQGNWQEITRQVNGHLTGKVSDGDFSGNVAGPTFSAQLSIRNEGKRQIVEIVPQGADVKSVSISMTRAG